jgi:A/G-specific adenine glycosylase
VSLECLPQRLLPWYAQHHRDLPWRRDREPYHVWLSEIMLQQTRVEAVKGYYTRFLEALPDIPALGAVEEDRLLKLWEGLGYYSRARNLKKAAQVILSDHGGQFPRSYDAIRALPGIGDYTAGAIYSICFDGKTPAVDGNVLRVVSRVLDDHRCTDDGAVKKDFSRMLSEIYPPEAGTFTQALMELGATVCVPGGPPKCAECPLESLCAGKRLGTAQDLPVRKAKKPRKQEDMTVFLMTCGDKLALGQRPATGLLAGLYELPHVPGVLDAQAIIAQAEAWGVRPQYLEKLVGRTHIFTHLQWNMTGARLHCAQENSQFLWVDSQEVLGNLALPTAFRQFLGDIWEDMP